MNKTMRPTDPREMSMLDLCAEITRTAEDIAAARTKPRPAAPPWPPRKSCWVCGDDGAALDHNGMCGSCRTFEGHNVGAEGYL